MIWDRFLKPSNSLVLLFDDIRPDKFSEWCRSLEEVGRYYTLSKISNLIDDDKPQMGRAFIVFKNPRRSLFLQAIPHLVREGIPLSLFLRPDCIGLNRLPPEEEFETYGVSDGDFQAWTDPVGAEAKLLSLRKEKGPLPIDKMDPGRFFATWGKIIEIPPALRTFGFHLFADPAHNALIDEAKAFTEKQVSQRLEIVYSSREVSERKALVNKGFKGLVTNRTGAVEKGTSVWNLPQWQLKENDEEKEDKK